MQARAVESRRHAEFDIFDQRGIAWRRHDAVGIIALIEHETLEDRLAIYLDRHPVDRNGAHSGVALGAIDNSPARVNKRDLQIIQMRITDRPELEPVIGNRQIEPWRQIKLRRSIPP